MVDGDIFRRIMGNFVTGVTVMTLPEPHGMTANAVSSVSLDPPLVLVCVDHDTECYELLEGGTDAYCLNILAEDQRELGEYYADMLDLAEDPFESRPMTAAETGAPVFENAIGYLDCTVEAAHEAGDHTIYVGRVEAGELLDGEADPLLFFRGQWAEL
ncbi:MAG: flavin reductase [Halobacteriales archaeon SW_9_67_25]|jgi:flavin reductase (DIM6/NTAB) family NADH-FMN oxidoreductase RutF|nr:MAG: flavin reductase [Halobacteriales archaeon SW_9_67_25]